MTRSNKNAWLAVAVLIATALAGCVSHSGVEGSFDRQLTVSGPTSLELASGRGDVHITAGPSGEVRIHGEIHVDSWSSDSGQRRLHEIETNPPISQTGNLIRIGGLGKQGGGNVEVDYTI